MLLPPEEPSCPPSPKPPKTPPSPRSISQHQADTAFYDSSPHICRSLNSAFIYNPSTFPLHFEDLQEEDQVDTHIAIDEGEMEEEDDNKTEFILYILVIQPGILILRLGTTAPHPRIESSRKELCKTTTTSISSFRASTNGNNQAGQASAINYFQIKSEHVAFSSPPSSQTPDTPTPC